MRISNQAFYSTQPTTSPRAVIPRVHAPGAFSTPTPLRFSAASAGDNASVVPTKWKVISFLGLAIYVFAHLVNDSSTVKKFAGFVDAQPPSGLTRSVEEDDDPPSQPQAKLTEYQRYLRDQKTAGGSQGASLPAGMIAITNEQYKAQIKEGSGFSSATGADWEAVLKATAAHRKANPGFYEQNANLQNNDTVRFVYQHQGKFFRIYKAGNGWAVDEAMGFQNILNK